jgi:hypothetical protein
MSIDMGFHIDIIEIIVLVYKLQWIVVKLFTSFFFIIKKVKLFLYRPWRPRAIMRLEVLDQLKNPVTSSGIELATFMFVA